MLNDGSWKGRRAWIVGGGPSLRSFAWERLVGIPEIICVNFAYERVPHAACVITEDVRFIQLAARKESWRAFRGEKILSCLEPGYEPLARAADPAIRIIPRKSSVRFWSKSLNDGLSYSSNSGIAAINLADILGVSEIVLLGFDCKPVGDTPTNFHDHYAKAPGFERTPDARYLDFKKDFEAWVAPNVRHIKVWNANPESGIECWERVTLESVLGRQREAAGRLVLHSDLREGSEAP